MRRIAGVIAATVVALCALVASSSAVAAPPSPKPGHCPPGHGNYPPQPCRLQTDRNTAAAGGTVTVEGEGFSRNCTVVIDLAGRQIGTARTDGNGDFSQQVTIPTDIAPGAYQLTATDCSGAVLGERFRVASAGGGQSSSGGQLATGAHEHDRLPFSGAVFYPLLAAAVLLLGSGALLILLGRRRRHTAAVV